MLCLGEKVRRDKMSICTVIREHGDLGRAGYGIYGYVSVDSFLSQGDENIARSRDLIDFFEALGTVSHGSDGLSAADLVDRAHAGFFGGDQSCRGDFSVLSWRCAHYYFGYTGYLCRDDVHENR